MIEVAYRQQSNESNRAYPRSSPPATSALTTTSAPASPSPRTNGIGVDPTAPLPVKTLKAPSSPLAQDSPASPGHRGERFAHQSTGGERPRQSAGAIAAMASTASSMKEQGGREGGKSAYISRIRRGQKLEEILPLISTPSLQQIDSPFQLQEYLALLVRQNPHDVEHIVTLPQANVAPAETFSAAKGKGKDSGGTSGEEHFMSGSDEEPHTVDTDVWVYEQLRRIVADFTTPWLTSLQRDCDRRQRPSTCDAMNADDWMYLCASHGEEKQCCAIDYIIHTLDGTTALLNSHRHFPSRTYIPTTSLRHFGSVSRRLSRIFVHAFEHHREVFEACEVETSLYARFLALVQSYDLIAIDSLPQLGLSKSQSSGQSAQDSDKNQARSASRHADREGDEYVGRGVLKADRQLFDHGEARGVPSDETGEDEDEDEVGTSDPLFTSQPASLQRSDSNASRITAIHVGGSALNENDGVGIHAETGILDESPQIGEGS